MLSSFLPLKFCRHFEEADTESVPPVLQQLTKLLQSQPMFKLLRTMTGLDMTDVLLDNDDDSSGAEDNSDEENKVN